MRIVGGLRVIAASPTHLHRGRATLKLASANVTVKITSGEWRQCEKIVMENGGEKRVKILPQAYLPRFRSVVGAQPNPTSSACVVHT